LTFGGIGRARTNSDNSNQGGQSTGSFGSLFRRDTSRFKGIDRSKHLGTFVGTPLYAAPEMLEFNQSGRGTDLWSLGCIVFELLTSKTPFECEQQSEVFNNIMERKLHFPPGFDKDAMDLVDKLLAYNPMERLGYSSMQELREHPFFKDIDFDKLDKQEIDIPLLDFFQELSRPEVTLNTEMDEDEDLS
jgi:serine/threonine protein kinase